MKSPLLPIFLIVVVDVLGLTIMIPLLPFYTEHFGGSPFVVGLLMGSYALCQLVAGPVLGQISDRVGRKPVLTVSQVGTFAGFLVLAYAPNLFFVFVGRIIDGLTAGNLSIAQAYIADVTAPRDRARAFAVIGIAFGIGFLVGPGASGYLTAHFGFRVPILCAAALSFLSICGTTFLLPPVPARPEGEQAANANQEIEAEVGPGGKRLRLLDWGNYLQYFRRPVLGGLLLEFFLFCLGFATFMAGFALFAERRLVWRGAPFGPKEVGFALMYAGFLGIVVQGSMRQGALVRRLGEVRLVTLGFLGAAIGAGIFLFTYGVPVLLVAMTVSSFGTGILRPALTSLITQQVSRNEQGVVLGLNQSLLSLAQIVGPAIAGALIDAGRLQLWAVASGASFFLALLLNLRARESRAHAAAQQV